MIMTKLRPYNIHFYQVSYSRKATCELGANTYLETSTFQEESCRSKIENSFGFYDLYFPFFPYTPRDVGGLSLLVLSFNNKRNTPETLSCQLSNPVTNQSAQEDESLNYRQSQTQLSQTTKANNAPAYQLPNPISTRRKTGIQQIQLGSKQQVRQREWICITTQDSDQQKLAGIFSSQSTPPSPLNTLHNKTKHSLTLLTSHLSLSPMVPVLKQHSLYHSSREHIESNKSYETYQIGSQVPHYHSQKKPCTLPLVDPNQSKRVWRVSMRLQDQLITEQRETDIEFSYPQDTTPVKLKLVTL